MDRTYIFKNDTVHKMCPCAGTERHHKCMWDDKNDWDRGCTFCLTCNCSHTVQQIMDKQEVYMLCKSTQYVSNNPN